MQLRRPPARALWGAALVLACTDEQVSLGEWGPQQEPLTSTSVSVATPTSIPPESGVVDEPNIEAGMPLPSSSGSSEPPDAAMPPEVPSGSEAGVVDAAAEASVEEPAEFPTCLEELPVDGFNFAGPEIGSSGTSTDWSWPEPIDSMRWKLMIEHERPLRNPDGTSTEGFYWVHQFAFVDGVAGRFGLQAEGAYSSVPGSVLEFTKMAVFWLSGPPLDAELGDIPFPDARVAQTPAAGANWYTIHAKFFWEPCHVYELTFAPDSTDEEGIWYSAWIDDTTDDTLTLLGRMLLPADTGALSPLSIFSTQPIEFGTNFASCSEGAHASAVFSAPETVDGSVRATLSTNRFSEPIRCPTSRFSRTRDFVRQELGVPRESL